MRSKFLKNLQWKKKLKRLGALGLCALLIAGNLTIPDVAKAASPGATYEVPDTGVIENVLTYFQYFTSGDCTLGNHTMGAVAVGGTLDGNDSTFGDAAKTASYAKKITNVVVPDAKPNFYGVCNDVYYETSVDMSTNQLVGFMQNPDYMNVGDMFNTIRTESSSLATADGTYTFTGGDITLIDGTEYKKIDVDFSNSPARYKIPYDVFVELDRINIVYDQIGDLLDNQCVISITGMTGKTDETFELIAGGNAFQTGYAAGENKVAVTFNDGGDRVLFNHAHTVNQDGQFFLGGMKLVFNLPDLDGTLRTECFSGHVVAPNAKVLPSGGNFEGGVIAREVYGVRGDDTKSAQAHYYPYGVAIDHYSCPTGSSGETIVCDDIILTKKYVSSQGGEAVSSELLPPAGYGAKFSLYQSDGTTLVEDLEDIEVEAYEGQYRLVISGEHLEKEKTYILKETVPAYGFEQNSESYYCHVDHKGDVEYSTTDGNYVAGRPVCENVKSNQEGTLTVTVKETTGSNISGVGVTIKVGDNEAVYRTGTTDGNGTVTFNNMPAAENYKVIIDDDIPEYEDYVNVASDQMVQTGETTNVIFELEKETVQQPETGSVLVNIVEKGADTPITAPITVTIKNTDTNAEQAYSVNTGSHIFSDLEPGTYEVSIPTTNEGYKELTEGANKKVVVVTAEIEENCKFELEKEQVQNPGTLVVTVKHGEEGKSGVTVTVTSVTNSSNTVGKQTATDGKATFENLLPGEYTVEISGIPNGYQVVGTNSTTATVPDGDTGECEFSLQTSTIKVVVVDESDNPVKGAGISVQDENNANVNLGSYETDNDGLMSQTELTPQKYTVTVTAPEGYTYINSETYTKTQLVGAGEEKEYKFVLTKCGTLEVTVKEDNANGAPVGGVEVIVTKEGENTSYATGTTDAVTGKATFEKVPVGEYTVSIPDVIDGYETLADNEESVDVEQNETAKAEFYLTEQQTQAQTGTIIVDVKETDENGNSISNVPVTLQKKDANDDYTDYVTGQKTETGTVTFENLPVGEYKVVIPANNTGYKTLENSECEKEVLITPNDTTGEAIFYLTPVGKLEIHVKDDNPTGSSYVEGVQVTVKDENGQDVSIGSQSTADVITIDQLTPGEYTVTIGGKDGYVVKNDQKTIEQIVIAGDTATVYNFTLAKTGKINVIIKDAVTDEEVSMGVAIKGPKFLANGKISNNATLEFNDDEKTIDYVTAGEHTYSLQNISPQEPSYGMASGKERNQTVNFNPYVDAEAEITFYVQKYATLEIDIYDITTGTPIRLGGDGDVIAKIEILRDSQSFDTKSLTYGNSKNFGLLNGQYQTTLTDLPAGYQVVSEDGNSVVTAIDPYDPNGPADGIYKVEFNVIKCGTVKVDVKEDNANGDPVDGVKVKLYLDKGNHNYEIFGSEQTTGADGIVTFTDVPVRDYKVVISKENGGYEDLTDAECTKEGAFDQNLEAKESFYLTPEQTTSTTGSLKVTVVEKGTTNNVPGVTVTITNKKDSTVQRYFTTNDTNGGVLLFDNIPTGTYIVEATSDVTGYKTLTEAQSKCEVEVKATPQATHTFEYEPEQAAATGLLKVTVVEKGTTTGIDGVTVTVVDSTGATHTADTNGNGQASFNNLPIGSCVITIPATVDGYETLAGNANKDTTVVIEGNVEKTSKFELVPEKTADLIITVKDEKTNDPVPGAKVKITKKAPANGTSNQDVSEVKETGKDGRIVMKGLRKGKYTTTVVSVPEGYNVTTDEEVVVDINPAAASEAQVDYKVGQVGALKVTITEKGTTNGIYGVQVAITTNASGTENTVYTYTDANGQVNLGGQKVGSYKISIPTSIAGYKELDAAYVVQTKDVEANKTTEYAFEVEKLTTTDPNKGEAEIIVKDEVTGNPVPGASVIVTAPDNTNRKYTTDGNGRITIPQQDPGDYKVEVIEVPEGYTVTQNKQTTITVVAGATVKAEIMVKPAEGNSGVGGSEVAPPTVGSGQGEAGTTPDNNGGAVNTGGTSDNTGDVVNTGGATDSNNGGVITTGQTAGATNNKTTDAQSVSKQPKTGDETNPGIIWIILSVSACLAAASVIGLVYVKKKED